jgi:2-phosphoglycerate kinase
MKIIMLCGVPGTGKTTMAYKLALALKIDKVLSMDVLKNAARAFMNPADHPYLFVDSHRAYAVEGHAMIESYLAHSAAANQLLLKTLAHTKDNLIIAEGVTLHADFAKTLANHDVLYINLTLAEPALRARYREKSKLRPDAWSDNLPRILEIQEYLTAISPRNLDNIHDGTLRKVVNLYEKHFPV